VRSGRHPLRFRAESYLKCAKKSGLNQPMGTMKSAEEWLKQADYDIETAEYMCEARRYLPAVFMCFSSIEKALKGVYRSRCKGAPPKTTNLLTLAEQIDLKLPNDVFEFLAKLNNSYPETLYPAKLATAQEVYTEPETRSLLAASKHALEWIRT